MKKVLIVTILILAFPVIGFSQIELLNDESFGTTVNKINELVEQVNKLSEAPVPEPVPEPIPTPEPVIGGEIVSLSISAEINSPWHIESGIPLSKGVVKQADQLVIKDAAGTILQAQFTPLVFWEDGSVKSVLVVALVESGSEYKIYAAENIKSIEGIKINGSILNNGLTETDLSKLIGEYYTVNTDMTENRYSDFTWEIEELGPIRTVAKFSIGTNFIRRAKFYLNRDYVILQDTFIDPRLETNVRSYNKPIALEFREYGLRFNIPVEEYEYELEGEIYQDSGEGSFVVNGNIDFINGQLKGYDFEKSDGWAKVNDNFGIALKDFSEQFPKGFRFRENEFTLLLHPGESSDRPSRFDSEAGRWDRKQTFYSPREGMAKTYEILISSGDIQTENSLFQSAPRLIASSEYYGKTKVFGDIIPSGEYSSGYDGYLNKTHDLSKTHLYLYGWRDFGDRMYPGYSSVIVGKTRFAPYYNGSHTGATTFAQQYIRTLDQRWWDLLDRESWHFRDIDVYHNPRYGMWRDWLKEGGPNYTTPPGEIAVDTHRTTDHFSRGVHEGHAHISALYEHYILTGDKRTLDVIKEIGDWWVDFVPRRYPPNVGENHMAEAERDFAWPQNVLNQVYRATGEAKYLEASVGIVKHCLAWWKVKKDHTQDRNFNGNIEPDEIVERFDYEQGTGYWWLSHNANVPNEWNGPNAWQGSALISNILQTLALDQKHTKLLNRDEVLDMLFQAMNQIVKWCYNPENGRFYYTITWKYDSRPTTDGGRHFYYPLARLYEIYKTEELAHKEWYTTVETWDDIVKKFYESAGGEVSETNSKGGFYGYEMVWPADFWAVAERIIQ